MKIYGKRQEPRGWLCENDSAPTTARDLTGEKKGYSGGIHRP